MDTLITLSRGKNTSESGGEKRLSVQNPGVLVCLSLEQQEATGGFLDVTFDEV